MARILVIDDEAPVRSAIRRILVRRGYEVEEIGDGQEGIERCRQEPADLVVVDMLMPGKSGLDVAQELKRDFPDVKIIVMSGDIGGEPDRAALAETYGVDRAMGKPFRTQDLLDTVEELLRDKR